MASDHHLYLIRHLPTAGNREKKYIGWTDEPIESVPNLVREFPMSATGVVYGSDLMRARQSAALLLPDADYVADARLRECHFGEFEGKTYADLELDKDYRNWLDDPQSFAPRGGESLAEVEKRVLETLVSLPNGGVVVTHGGPIRIALTRFSPEPRDFWSWQIPHGSAWKFEWRNYDEMKEGGGCVSLSEVPITGKEPM
ncbi:histidine phosphatase family protein [Sporosarcina sp. ACRSL]|uniref:histidine phosphatase family protein n=1 Tax=Sporosarcina sp. ACRSL TaxID=2918215 RepID=UPI001EF490BF|nr:histidine phosphatase family protein [Sporosarcina sp. ACRSL]MCG7343869.1 histidine phosphatase family protein [Sporosarcina sp. ACRSL]